MNYSNHYSLLISRAKSRSLSEYTERHHVIPQCVGGDNSENNLVSLTPEEHYLAHLLLVKIHPTVYKLVYAANMMCLDSPSTPRNNKRYGWIRRRLSAAAKTRVGDKNGSFGKSWYYDPTTFSTGKFIEAEVPNGWVNGRAGNGKPPCKSNKCAGCNKQTNTRFQLWCDTCRGLIKRQTVFRANKEQCSFSDLEKLTALRTNEWNIRRALYSLGLSDSGSHYAQMRRIKASVYPLPAKE